MRREIAAQFNSQVTAAPSALTATDEEIEAFLTLEFAEGRTSRWRIWIEQLREHTAGLWSMLGRGNGRMTVEAYRRVVEVSFRPVMDRLLLTGLLTIKYDAGFERFQNVVDLLIEIFGRWWDAQRLVPWQDGSWNDPPEIVSGKVPALEAYFAAFALLGFTLRVTQDVRYAWILFPRIVTFAAFGRTETQDEALLFWHYSDEEGPHAWIDDLIASRMPRGGRIDRLFEGEAGLREAIVQADCFIEWHSNLSQKGDRIAPFGSLETIEFFQTFFPKLNFPYRAVCLFRSFRLVIPLLEKVHKSLKEDATRFSSFDLRLASVLDAMKVETRELLLGRFLWYLEREQARTTFQAGQAPPRIYWPDPFGKLVEGAKEESRQSK